MLLQYRIRRKELRTTMYSGSNFVKAFSAFVEQIQSEDAESESDQESSITWTPSASWRKVMAWCTSFPHTKGACHLLNLVATTDAYMKEKKTNKKKTMWNRTGHSYMEAEAVEDNCQLQLTWPNQMRWYSTFMKMWVLISMLTVWNVHQ